MKKVLTVLMAVTMVMGFAAMASAVDAINCKGEPGRLIAGCAEQGACETFDFENAYNYCDPGKTTNRAVFPVCECDQDFIDNMSIGEKYTVGMKILVDKGTGTAVEGNNGVYWGEVPVNIPMQTFSSQGAACDSTTYADAFLGDFQFMLANGDTMINGTPVSVFTGSGCPEAINEVVEFDTIIPLDAEGNVIEGAEYGYEIKGADIIGQNSNWAIDIPGMIVDPSKVQPGWVVWVEVCISEAADAKGTICGDCGECCFMLKIGTLCCEGEDPATISDTLVFPYLGKTNGGWWNGMAITNLSSVDGTAAVTLYENGDVFTGTVSVGANNIALISVDALTLTTAGGDGEMGNERSYVVVKTDGFHASGFAMMAKEANGVSMGYLAEK